MSCIENINRYVVPNDLIKALTEVYKYIGRNESYNNLISKNDMKKIVEQTIERDAFYIGKIINLNLTDNRLRLIITKTSEPRNKEEAILTRLMGVLTDFQNKTNLYGVKTIDQKNMITYIYDPKHEIKYDAKIMNNGMDKKQYLDQLTDILYSSDDNFESIILLSNYFIDLFNLKPFAEYNELCALLTLYLLILKSEINCFKYVSFFEFLYNNYEEFNEKLINASLNWQIGMSQPTDFISFIVKLIKEAYDRTENIIKTYKEDQNISKGDNIENTIFNELPREFTKEDLRQYHPYVSESTINRALQKLRDENKIEPIGKGRSAKWRRTNLSNI